MQTYIGVKIIEAEPQKCLKDIYNSKFGDPGYTVRYPDGYVSWSPKDVFEDAYKPLTGMNFGLAIESMKKGHKTTRIGWNGKNMWVALMDSLKLPPNSSDVKGPKVNDRTAKYIGVDTPLDSQPYFSMMTVNGKWQPGWLPSQADILADDWCVEPLVN